MMLCRSSVDGSNAKHFKNVYLHVYLHLYTYLYLSAYAEIAVNIKEVNLFTNCLLCMSGATFDFWHVRSVFDECTAE